MVTKFEFGRRGEIVFSEWAKKRGYYIVPCSLIENGGAPMLEGAIKKHILPDFLASKDGESLWVDVKTKTRHTFNVQRGRPETGIDFRHWQAYNAVAQSTGIPGALAFVHCDMEMIHFGRLDQIVCDMFLYVPDPEKPGHFREPMVFFDLNRFDWFRINEKDGIEYVKESSSPPAVLRPWEKARPPPTNRQGYLFETDGPEDPKGGY